MRTIPGCCWEKASTTARVASAEQSSQITISCTGIDWAAMLRSCSCKNFAPLYVHIATEMRCSMSQNVRPDRLRTLSDEISFLAYFPLPHLKQRESHLCV